MRLLILGTGLMAQTHAQAFAQIDGVSLVAAVELDPTRRADFSSKFNIEHSFASIEDALDWGQFDAVTNVTPDAVHHSTTLPCLAAGKHVLCEKPLATNYADAADMTRAAQDAGWLTQPAWGDWTSESAWLWRLSTAHGSHGVLGDVGVHIVDFVGFATGMDVTSLMAKLHTFAKAPGDKIGDYPLDANDSFTMSATLGNGALASIHASRFASGHLNDLSLRIYGTAGGVEVTNTGDLGTLRACLQPDLERASWSDIALAPVQTNFQRFTDAVRTGAPMNPDFAHAAKLQAVLDAAQLSGAQGKMVAVSEI